MTTILLTGATDGIGLALAQLYAAQGVRLVLVGRRPLSSLIDPLFTSSNYCQCDLSQTDCAETVTAWLQQQAIDTLDVVVHNAATAYYGSIPDQPANSIETLLDVNLYAPIRLTHALLPWLRLRTGKLVFVSTVAAQLPVPEYAVYAASKAALEGFAHNLRLELGGKVQVQVIRPGATHTGMHAKAGIPPDVLDWQRFPPAEKVARQMMQAINGRRPKVTLGMGNVLLGAANHFAPALLAQVQQRRRPLWDGVTVARGERPFAVITGAADGIGRALALELAHQGWDIGGIDIDPVQANWVQAELTSLGVEADFLMADLTSPIGLAAAQNHWQYRPIDLLVHNVGISHVGHFASSPLPPQMKVLDLNLRAPLLLTAALLRQGRLSLASGLVFMSSLSRFVGYPGAAVYAASKDGLAAYANSLRVASSPNHHITTVYPGPTRTAHARRYSPDNSREAKRMPPEDLAAQIVTAVQRQRAELVPGSGNKLFALVGRWLPAVTGWVLRRSILDQLEVSYLSHDQS